MEEKNYRTQATTSVDNGSEFLEIDNKNEVNTSRIAQKKNYRIKSTTYSDSDSDLRTNDDEILHRCPVRGDDASHHPGRSRRIKYTLHHTTPNKRNQRQGHNFHGHDNTSQNNNRHSFNEQIKPIDYRTNLSKSNHVATQ
ncbi:hypothetical protein ABEB36_002492 [Hypothenemus hampei]|uniref:Uncharacterized protein n=1 Tax=Hypothenemus hampei TaxID=57062 RepID=A0ABD1F7N1_HYPHA